MREAIAELSPNGLGWPSGLAHIDAPPTRLWTRGQASWLADDVVRVAIVGSRAPTPYGLAQATRFARELARCGVVVVSGMARGVDEAAHRGALGAGGATLAVLGSGVDRPWPAGELAEAIACRGALLSEFAPGTAPRRHHFPRRNRLISGLSRAVLVIEAAQASGSLITARWAADQGRAVLALPGRVDHPMARGCHRLLREGALLAEDPEDVLAAIDLAGPARSREGATAALAPQARALLEALRGETLTADELCARAHLELDSVLCDLVGLELSGDVVRLPGGLWQLSAV